MCNYHLNLHLSITFLFHITLLQEPCDLFDSSCCRIGVSVYTSQATLSIVIERDTLLATQDPWVMTAIAAEVHPLLWSNASENIDVSEKVALLPYGLEAARSFDHLATHRD